MYGKKFTHVLEILLLEELVIKKFKQIKIATKLLEKVNPTAQAS